MVLIYRCDKCGKELKNKPSEFDAFLDRDLFREMEEEFRGSRFLHPHLCKSCGNDYNKIVDDTNKKIKEWLKNDNRKKVL